MLDFSKVWKPRKPLYDAYFFKVNDETGGI